MLCLIKSLILFQGRQGQEAEDDKDLLAWIWKDLDCSREFTLSEFYSKALTQICKRVYLLHLVYNSATQDVIYH